MDVFNLSEAIATGRRSDADLAHLFQTQYFDSIVLNSLTPFSLGPHLKSVVLAHYRVVRMMTITASSWNGASVSYFVE